MSPHRIVTSAVLCALLATGATACGSSTSTTAKAAPSGSAAAVSPTAASPSASASASGTVDLDSLTAAQVEDAAHAAMASLTSMRVAGSTTSDGQKITFDLTADKAKDCQGTVTIGSMGSIEILHNSTGSWVKPDQAFWKSAAAQQGKPGAGAMAAELFKGRYLTGGQDDPDMKQMTSMCDVVEGIANDTSKATNATKVGPATVNGQKTLGIKDTDDDGTVSTGYVATEGKPYLLRLVSEGSDGGQLDFTDFDKPLTVQAPPADQVVDFSLFKQKLNSV
ncbi:hypothetical protein ACFW1A_28765 [Kitasatospora sp. NPDC058965]|uniref:hypothetical protein n=1 Tax=Kitasatospora sp. NPDC058965 TaxID=3346682 RepID=UPI00369061BB